MDDRADGDVIARSLEDPAVFGVIYDRHSRAIYRYVRRRIGDDAAADLTSEVFTRAFRDRARYAAINDSALPWLLGIATNLLRMHRRTEERRLRAYARAQGQVVGLSDEREIDDRLDAEAARGALAEALAALPARQRDVLLLSAWAELSPSEIAAALGEASGTVRSDLHRARTFLTSRLAAFAPLVSDQDPI